MRGCGAPPARRSLRTAAQRQLEGVVTPGGTVIAPPPKAFTAKSAREALQNKLMNQFKSLRNAFRTADKDASGRLDRDEIRSVFERFNLPLDDEEFGKVMCNFDKDGDGSIEYGEFLKEFGNAFLGGDQLGVQWGKNAVPEKKRWPWPAICPQKADWRRRRAIASCKAVRSSSCQQKGTPRSGIL